MPQLASKDALTRAIEVERKRATVRPLDLSFNELADMYSTGELHITPEYQRMFRWSRVKKSQFIESVILEMPVPPIYVVEVQDGKWELIDGLQRISTYLHFRGQLQLNVPEEEIEINLGNTFKLDGCDIVSELNGYGFDDLTTSLQHRVRRATLRVEVVRRESNPKFSYYMFKRLNTGGEPLSEQEVRNCSIRILGKRFIEFISALTADENFKECIDDLTEESRFRMGDEELVLRFFAFKNNLDEYVHDIDPFLTSFMERVTDESATNHIHFDYELEHSIFTRTFAILANALGASSCRRWVPQRGNPSVGTFGGGFSKSHFEAFSIGLARIAMQLPDALAPDLRQRIKGALLNAKKDQNLRDLTVGGGKNFRKIYQTKIEIIESYLRAAV